MRIRRRHATGGGIGWVARGLKAGGILFFLGDLVVFAAFVAFVAACHGPGAQAAPKVTPGTFTTPAKPKAYARVRIAGVPYVRQKPDFCGEAVLASAIQHAGYAVTQDEVFALTGVDPLVGRGAYTAELKHAAEAFGFSVGPVWRRVKATAAPAALDRGFAAIHADLKAGIPSIVCMHFNAKPKTTEHFRLILGYDPSRDEILYHEPALPKGAYRRMARRTFLSLWPLKGTTDVWTLIRLRLDPKTLNAATVAKAKAKAKPVGRFSLADFAQHMRSLRPRIPAGFSVVLEPPFVVLGDQGLAAVRRRARGTVRWTAERLKRAYFSRDPLRILDIWLFKDKTSYRRYAWEIFKDRPGTPYGYYSPAHGALIMNISTGGGTLVHEIVHPFVEANFPNCPPWFNEGLGSLYEQCGDEGGKIHGYTNWRLAGLQAAIRRHRVPHFSWLARQTSEAFYNKDPGTNYGQSRYLLYYLQQKGLLRRYYKAFSRARLRDPTGYQTLKRVLGQGDMAAFKRRWEAWILKLRYPDRSKSLGSASGAGVSGPRYGLASTIDGSAPRMTPSWKMSSFRA
ncbi:MAG: C39 family peptidase [Deltaproteobacteria bacterium]|nr:C39 family peptidase [Deltaproteobacteria bacterium]